MAETDKERQITLEELEEIITTNNIPPNQAEDMRRDVKLSTALQAYLQDAAEKARQGEAISYEEMCAEMNRIAKEHGVEHGIPLPSFHDIQRPLILPNRSPLAHITEAHRLSTEFQEFLETRGTPVRNSWNMLGDASVCVVNTEAGPMTVKETMAGSRLRRKLDTFFMRLQSQQTAEAELRAMESLKKRITERQWEMYVLEGMFFERSKRSDLRYFFRKGLPTLVLSYHGKFGEEEESGHFIAALCLHPLGYYQGTHCGLMVPTDEVICHLLMMRGDEARYWSKCGQWKVWDSRSGI